MTRLAAIATLVCIAAIGTSGIASGAQKGRLRFVEAPPTKAGWWVRINDKTVASKVSIAVSPKPQSKPVSTHSWDGRRREFDLPESTKVEDMLHLDATAAPDDAFASVCVFYQKQGVEQLEFKGKKSTQINRKHTAEGCAP